VQVTPVLQSFPEALLAATEASHRIVDCGDRRIGYLHLWAGTGNGFLEIERRAVAAAIAAGVEGYVLDLRDGYGGAWWPYLDPFFADRRTYFTYTTIDRHGETPPSSAEPQSNPDAWLGPLAVIINDGTRSGKESLAYQFKRSGRALLVGGTTAGAFVAGYGAFADRDVDYTMMMSVEEFRLDGTVIEGAGVTPDVPVPERPGTDAPLAAALAALSCPG
jgi:carboxyl-terminal processing protease